jgi:hypothetical protein
MKKLNLLLSLLIITLLIGGCSSDSEAPKEQFKGDGETISLKNAKLYLVDQSNYSNAHGDFIYRDYFLTDGTYVSGSGWSLSDYTNATYLVSIEPIVLDTDDFAVGSYPSVYSFSTVTDNGVYFYMETAADESLYYESTSGESIGTVSISGSLDDGGTATIKLSGKVSKWVYDVNWTETEITGSMYVKAEVVNVMPI